MSDESEITEPRYIRVSFKQNCLGWMTDCVVRTSLRMQDKFGEYTEPMCYKCIKKQTEFYRRASE